MYAPIFEMCLNFCVVSNQQEKSHRLSFLAKQFPNSCSKSSFGLLAGTLNSAALLECPCNHVDNVIL
jgi:hypothetical protein